MDKPISTVILTCVAVALAIAMMTYYPGIVRSLLNYERLGFDYAYASVRRRLSYTSGMPGRGS